MAGGKGERKSGRRERKKGRREGDGTERGMALKTEGDEKKGKVEKEYSG